MEAKVVLISLVLVSMFMACSSGHAPRFYHVGGKEGWVPHPSEPYDHWSSRMRFQVNDYLVFSFNGSDDSVLLVDKRGFDTCNGSRVFMKLKESKSWIHLYRPGTFFFISGNLSHCKVGQKLVVVVLAKRHKKLPPLHVAPSPSPLGQASPSPLALSPSPIADHLASPPSGSTLSSSAPLPSPPSDQEPTSTEPLEEPSTDSTPEPPALPLFYPPLIPVNHSGCAPPASSYRVLVGVLALALYF